MLLEVILAFFAGILIGTLTGLIPGVHINLVAALLLSLLTAGIFHQLGISNLSLLVFLVCLAITHTFIDVIPSIFLGAPAEQDTALSILPGHEMLLQGKAQEALVLTFLGCLIGAVLTLLLTPFFLIFLPFLYPYAQKIMPLILILVSFYLIYFEKSNKLFAALVFLLSGILGLITLNLPLKETLLPLFTGLFGISSLLTSLFQKQKIPPQQNFYLKDLRLEKKSLKKTILAGIIASPLCSFLPGLGSGQAAVIGSEISGEVSKKEFLFLLGMINLLVLGLSFVTLYTISKTRTGISVAIKQILELNLFHLLLILLLILLASLLSFYLGLKISRNFSKLISKVNYSILSLILILFLLFLNFLIAGFLGLLLILASTCLGLFCIYSQVRRTHLMGCLILPSIVLNLL